MSMAVASALRERLALTKPISNCSILQVALAAACTTDALELISYMFSKSLALEVGAAKDGLITEQEWAALFIAVRPSAPKVATDVTASVDFAAPKAKMEQALEHTLAETDQARA